MIEIKDLLLRFNSLLVSEEIKISSLIEAIKELTNITIKKEEVKIKGGTVYLSIKPIYKNEIFLKKEKIISKITESLGKKAPKDIL